MILVTGANGKTGRAVAAALVKRGEPVRAWVRSIEQSDELRRLGAADIVAGTMADIEVASAAVRDVRAIYFICPNMSSFEELFGHNLIAAAKSAGVRRFVFHSVLHPHVEAMSHHWSKMRVEAALFESDLDWTILQPTAYMQNLLVNWSDISERGVYVVPFGIKTRISLVDLDDVGAVAAKVLCEPDHHGAIYELVGTGPCSQIEVAEILGDALGRVVRAEAEPIETWEARARNGGTPAPELGRLSKMYRYYDRHGLVGNANALRGLLARPPASLVDFVRKVRSESLALQQAERV